MEGRERVGSKREGMSLVGEEVLGREPQREGDEVEEKRSSFGRS